MATVYKWYYDHLDDNKGQILVTNELQEPDVNDDLWILVKCEKYENGCLYLLFDPFKNINHLKKYH